MRGDDRATLAPAGHRGHKALHRSLSPRAFFAVISFGPENAGLPWRSGGNVYVARIVQSWGVGFTMGISCMTLDRACVLKDSEHFVFGALPTPSMVYNRVSRLLVRVIVHG